MRSNSLSMVANSLAPVAPSGCPKAIAPPFGLTFFRSTSSSLAQASTTGANASLISTTSMSSMVRPVFSSAYRVAGIGPVSMNTGSSPRALMWWTRALGVSPCALTACSEATSVALPPSEICEANAAVRRPPSTRGFRLASFSRVDSRGPSSTRKSPTGMISLSKCPLRIAAKAFSWLESAKRSISSRLMSHFSAIISAPRNWEIS
ncbi:Uncharacterised protein [Mycobacteroides abscessus]|nr:Uncharacterised protein [Mycobacteroides abscessus]